ncbi:MAG: type II toxin-antitoxin system VapC family toxin [Actinobacteria bacterium]|nr:type II toxin-antitoxin system VapC family toxin [Actinomycetota bacterium]
MSRTTCTKSCGGGPSGTVAPSAARRSRFCADRCRLPSTRKRSWQRSRPIQGAGRGRRTVRRRRRSSGATGTPVSALAVFDASALVRALRTRHPKAREWRARAVRGEVRAIAPDLVFAEVGNAFLVEHRAGGMPASEVAASLERLVRIPVAVVSTKELVRDAAAIASARRLSLYDACYVALAEANDAVLVTADRKLAGACARSELLI